MMQEKEWPDGKQKPNLSGLIKTGVAGIKVEFRTGLSK